MLRVSLYWLLLLLNWIDYHTTKLIIDRDGIQAESNPILRYAMEICGGVHGIAYVKLAALVICLYVWWHMKYWTIALVLILYAVVTLQTIYTIGINL